MMNSDPDQFRVPDCSIKEQRWLLTWAHSAIRAAVQGQPPLRVSEQTLTDTLRQPAATFVTLTLNRQLRGCVGNLIARDPLHESVRNNAVSAALRDNRFAPVSPDEAERLRVHLSLLSPLVPLHGEDPASVLEQITPGLDGVVLRQGGRSATYLPQVWKSFPDKESFLGSLSRKAGLEPSAWKEADAELLIYRVSGFGDAADG
jgi:AmmeMemoRadiSam system protein A